ncbi:MAG TPA: response regulator [Polyangiaceae bacterium]
MLILDCASSGRDRLANSFGELGYRVWAADGIDAALKAGDCRSPQVVVVEPTIEGWRGLRLVRRLRTIWPDAAHVVLTAKPSFASAVRALHNGVATYLVKPTTAQHILASLPGAAEEEEAPPVTLTLDRAIWEYMSEVVETAGSISEASRRLGVERRSLRRMLAKYAPR